MYKLLALSVLVSVALAIPAREKRKLFSFFKYYIFKLACRDFKKMNRKVTDNSLDILQLAVTNYSKFLNMSFIFKRKLYEL